VERPVLPQKAGFAAGARVGDIEKRLTKWAGLTPALPRTVAFVGHCKQQQACLHALGGPKHIAADRRACVLVYERGPDGCWTAGPYFEGS